MKADRFGLILCCIIFYFAGFSGYSNCAFAEQEREGVEQALEIARRDRRVKDILTDFPQIRMQPNYSDQYGVWIIEFLVGDREAGMASVSLEQKAVVEFNFNINEITEADDFEDERQIPFSLKFLFSRLRPRFEAASLAWLSIVLVFIFAGNFTRLFSLRNLDIVLLYLLCPSLIVIWQNQKFAYAGIFVVTVLFFLRSVFGVWVGDNRSVLNNVRLRRAACLVLVLVFLFHVQTTYEKPVDDSGLFSVIGAEYWKQSGKLPYGTEFGNMGVYGPLMYALHIPANWLFPPHVSFNKESGDVEWRPYHGFQMRGAQTIVLIFDLLAIIGLYWFGKKYADKTTGVLLVLIFALSPYVLGVGGIGGLQWSSHIIGIAFVVFALVFVTQPILAGLLLGVVCGMLYYPVFLLPLWFGYYVRTSGWRQAFKFLAAIAAVGLVCLAMILTFTVPAGEYQGMSPLRAFLRDTVYQQQFSEWYGNSPFSFWGQYPALAKWAKPMVGILYLLFCLLVGLIPRQMDMKRLVALTAAVLVGIQLTLSHGTGTYIGFYIAPFIVTLFGPQDYPKLATT